MKFSVWPSPGRPTDEILNLAQTAEALGFFGFWFADHYMPDADDGSPSPGDMHEVWGILPAVAAVTQRLRIGSLVSPTTVHHPAVLANRAATLDHVSKGRTVLGIGAGWQVNEHKAYGIDLMDPKPRVDRFEEAIQVIRSLLDQESTTFDGSYYQLSDAPSNPSPVQDQLPILVGTGGPRMCGITATHAQEWNTWGGPEMAQGAVDTFSKACEREGVDPGSLHTSVQALFFPTNDPSKVEAIMGAPTGERSIAGSNEQIVDAIGQYADMGFNEVIVPDFTLGKTPQDRIDAYERFAADILPQCS